MAEGSQGGIVNPLSLGESLGEASSGSPSKGEVVFRLDGSIAYFGAASESGFPQPNEWFTPSGVGTPGNNYWIRATVTTGALTSGTTGTWIPITSNIAFTKGPNANGSAQATVTFDIASDAIGSNIVTHSVGWRIGYDHNL